jgi:hypothetical protein
MGDGGWGAEGEGNCDAHAHHTDPAEKEVAEVEVGSESVYMIPVEEAFQVHCSGKSMPFYSVFLLNYQTGLSGNIKIEQEK